MYRNLIKLNTGTHICTQKILGVAIEFCFILLL